VGGGFAVFWCVGVGIGLGGFLVVVMLVLCWLEGFGHFKGVIVVGFGYVGYYGWRIVYFLFVVFVCCCSLSCFCFRVSYMGLGLCVFVFCYSVVWFVGRLFVDLGFFVFWW